VQYKSNYNNKIYTLPPVKIYNSEKIRCKCILYSWKVSQVHFLNNNRLELTRAESTFNISLRDFVCCCIIF